MTWSILVRDPATGSFGIAVASHARGVGKSVPFIESDVGAVATQGMVNREYGPQALQLLTAGGSPQDAIREMTSVDAWRDERQIHVMDRRGRSSAFTGRQCSKWSGHLSSANVSIAGNMLVSGTVIAATLKAYEKASRLPFVERLLTAMDAGEAMGGDFRGTRSAAILISDSGHSPAIRLEVDDSKTPLSDLREKAGAATDSRQSGASALMMRQTGSLGANHVFSLGRGSI